MQKQAMNMQQQAMEAGRMTPEMIQQMMNMGAASENLDMSALSDMSELFGDDSEEIKAFIAAHPQPKELSKYLALGSFFVTMESEPVETLELRADVEYYIENTEESWDIGDRESLLEMLESLFEGYAYIAHNKLYLDLKADKKDNASDEDIEDYQATMESLHEIGISDDDINRTASILAWDLERLAHLSRVSAHIGYITQEEAWEWLKKASKKAKENFKDWREYTVSIVMGRALQMGYHESYFYAIDDLLNEKPDFLNERPLSNM